MVAPGLAKFGRRVASATSVGGCYRPYLSDVMTAREIEIVKEAKAAIQSVEPEAEVLLFGSRARGEAHEESDFDLLVVTPERVSTQERGAYLVPIMPIEQKYMELLSMTFVPRAEWEAQRTTHTFLRVVNREGYRV